jgi:hypothetical protein
MKNKARLVVAGVALAALTTLGAGTAAYAHHAFAAEFDADAPVLLKGKVVVVEWVNPHTWIHLEVAKDDGAKEAWAVEGGTPNSFCMPCWRKRWHGCNRYNNRIVFEGEEY